MRFSKLISSSKYRYLVLLLVTFCDCLTISPMPASLKCNSASIKTFHPVPGMHEIAIGEKKNRTEINEKLDYKMCSCFVFTSV